MIATAGTDASDCALVDAVRDGDDAAFEELYRRYHPRIAGFIRGMLHDEARAEDVAQEAFFSALRRMRSTDTEINFKPWIYQIARNAAIDSYRRNSHAVEVSMDADDGLRASDRHRLVGIDGGPDAALVTKERLNHLQSAFDELSDVHTQGARHARARGHVVPRDRRQARPHPPGRRERAVPRAPPARERVRGDRRRPPLQGDAGDARAHGRGNPSRDGGAPPRAAPQALLQLPAPRARARDPAADRRSGRCARRPPRSCRSRGSSAARVATAAASQACSPRERTPPRWPSAPRLWLPRPPWWAREARLSEVERFGGTTRRPVRIVTRSSTPRR